MKKLLVLVMVTACSGTASPPPQPPRTTEPAATKPATEVSNTAGTSACTDSVAKLEAWLKDLIAEGHPTVMTTGINLVTVAEAATPIPAAPVVTVTTAEVSFQGSLLGTTAGKPAALTKAVADAMKKAPAGSDVVFVIDDHAPWSAVVAAVGGAATAGRAHSTFVFASSAPSHVAAPPASSVDAELDALAKPSDSSAPAASLGKKSGTVPDKIFKDCAPVTRDLFPKLAATDDKDAVVQDGLPKAIAACSCHVEMPAVQRLMWSWWGRDSSKPLVAITVDVAKGGTAVKGKGAWSDAHKVLLAAAKQGKPVTLQ